MILPLNAIKKVCNHFKRYYVFFFFLSKMLNKLYSNFPGLYTILNRELMRNNTLTYKNKLYQS